MDHVYDRRAEEFDSGLEEALKTSQDLDTGSLGPSSYEGNTSDDTRRTGGLRRISERFASDRLQEMVEDEHRSDATAVIEAHAAEKKAGEETITKQAAVLGFIEAAKSLKG